MRRPLPVRPCARTLVLALCSVALAGPGVPQALSAQAQATTGIIRGEVRSPTGMPVPHASVTAINQGTGLERRVLTNNSGVFVFSLLPVGTYDVTVESMAQFGTIRRTGVRVRLGEAVDLDLRYRPVEVEELRVTGEGEPPLVDPSELTSSQRLDEEVVDGLPNDGRNFLDFTQLTPGVTITQGPDGEEISIAGQRGIFNNVIVDGADFNNPFFGEQRGGQRPAFTFNLDAVEDLVVINGGAPAEFGRTAGGIINVITKSGTNEFHGSAHYFGQFDETSAEIPGCTGPSGASGVCDFPFAQNQFGFTLGGPIVRDRAFFFVAYDQQEGSSAKQLARDVNIADPAELDELQSFLDGAFGGALADDFGPVERTNDSKALMAKVDVNLSSKHQASLKYNFTWSEQVNGTFDVDSWGRSANGIEKDKSHAINGSLSSQLSSAVSNEFRFQVAREDRPRPYDGPLLPGSDPLPFEGFPEDGRPFPDTGMDPVNAFRVGLPFFLPIETANDKRLQLLDNVTFLKGDHLFKTGVEWNRTGFEQQFLGFANSRYIFNSVDGFIGFVENGPGFVTCSDGSTSTDGTCPDGASVTGPVLLYLQSATVPPVPTSQLGRQSATMDELAFFVQDTWKPNDKLTVNAGLRWEGTWHPAMKQAPSETFYADFLGVTKEGSGGEGPFDFPSDGTIPDDLNNFQPRFSFTYDAGADGRTVFRGSAGSYFSRIPMLVFAQHRVTNGSFQQTLFRNSELSPILGPPPAYGELLDTEGVLPFGPSVQVPSDDLELPRTWNFTAEVQRMLGDHLAARVNYQHARTDQLFRFRNLNSPVFGSPWATGIPADFRDPTSPADTANGISASAGDGSGLVVAESSAKSRYNAVTLGFSGQKIGGDMLEFDVNYTLAFDKSSDDNERDPFTYRYARADVLGPEFNWSNRDRRHQVNAYFLTHLPLGVTLNNVLRGATAQPTSESCGPRGPVAGLPGNPFAAPEGERANSRVDRLCADGSVLKRNTLRKDNGFFEWDVRATKTFPLGDYEIEVIAEAFNVTNANNFRDTDTELLFNFDGTIRSGLSDPRRIQLGTKLRF